MTTNFTYAIQPSYLAELTDHCFVPSPDIESAKSIAWSQAQDEATDQNIWKVPLGGKAMLWERVYYNDPANKPYENPGDDGDLLAYTSEEVI